MTEKQLTEVEKLAQKNESLKAILAEWQSFKSSPYLESYNAIKRLLDEWISQIEGGVKHIDIFSDKDDKSFDRALKLSTEGIDSILISLESIRLKMCPEEQAETEKKVGSVKNKSISV